MADVYTLSTNTESQKEVVVEILLGVEIIKSIVIESPTASAIVTDCNPAHKLYAFDMVVPSENRKE